MHAALADPARLRITDTLLAGDASPSELAGLLAMPSNLLAHHLHVLEQAGIITRRRSEGCTAGAVAANLMFALPAVTISVKHRATPAHFLSEVIATLGLLLVIFALARSGRSRSAPAAVGAYIGAAYWFTSSTSFANPAITIGRMFSNTFAGIAPSSVPSFFGAQILGGILAVGIIKALYPAITPADAAGGHRPPQRRARGRPRWIRRRVAIPGSAVRSGPVSLSRQPEGALPCTWS